MSLGMLNIDLTNYVDTQGDFVPTGTYTAVVEWLQDGVSSRKKTPQLTVGLRIIEGDCKGKLVVDNLYLTEASMFRVVGFLKGCGMQIKQGQMSIPHERLKGKRTVITTGESEYNGNVRTDVKNYVPYSGPQVEAPAPAPAPEPAPATPAPAAAPAATEPEVDNTLVAPQAEAAPAAEAAPVTSSAAEDAAIDGALADVDLSDL